MPHAKPAQLVRLEFERGLWSSEFTLIAGVDEAGRGPLAGPVVAAAGFFQRFITTENARPQSQRD